MDTLTKPYDLPGKWYVLHTKPNHENKVRQAIESRAKSMMVEDKIYDIYIPMHSVTEIKKGKKQVAEKKTFPGYLLVRCNLDDTCWDVLRNSPGVTGFLGGNDKSDRVEDKATPLSRKDVERFIVLDDAPTDAPKVRAVIDFEVNGLVTVNEGPFSDFTGQIIAINEDQLTLKVSVNIFGRETPVELAFDQVTKA